MTTPIGDADQNGHHSDAKPQTEYDLFRDWFFKGEHGVVLTTLIVTTLGIFALVWQNTLIREGNKATQDALALTRAQIKNDSNFSVIAHRPYIRIEEIRAWKIEVGDKIFAIAKLKNSGIAPGFDLQVTAVFGIHDRNVRKMFPSKGASGKKMVIYGGVEKEIPMYNNKNVTKETHRNIMSGASVLYLFGTGTYYLKGDDQQYGFTYCRQYKPTTSDLMAYWSECDSFEESFW